MQPPKILPPHYFAVCIVLILVVGLTEPTRYDHWISYLGIFPILVGVAVAIAASRQFSKADTNIIPLTRSTTLVTDGCFSFSRNPMYVGMILALAGTALLTGGLTTWLIVVGFFFLIRTLFVLREEPLMTETFGEDYRAYCSRVRRWI